MLSLAPNLSSVTSRSLPRPAATKRGRPTCLHLALCAALCFLAHPVEAQSSSGRETDPTSTKDLLEIEKKVEAALKSAIPATVGVSARGTYGSGVIVSANGYVLTAGHVSTQPGRTVRITLHDGRRVTGETLGWGQREDLGLIKINSDDDETWPFVKMGDSDALERGDWCIAIGHPGGYEAGRAPVVRTGRLLSTWRMLRTDCPIASGDSGGPLLDLDGRVIGIHSRINTDITRNYHVPVSSFQESWARLTSAESWGRSMIGVRGVDNDGGGYRVTSLVPGYPAEKAGLKVNDVIKKVDDREITVLEHLSRAISRKRAGSTVKLVIERGSETIEIDVKVADRSVAE